MVIRMFCFQSNDVRRRSAILLEQSPFFPGKKYSIAVKATRCANESESRSYGKLLVFETPSCLTATNYDLEVCGMLNFLCMIQTLFVSFSCLALHELSEDFIFFSPSSSDWSGSQCRGIRAPRMVQWKDFVACAVAGSSCTVISEPFATIVSVQCEMQQRDFWVCKTSQSR